MRYVICLFLVACQTPHKERLSPVVDVKATPSPVVIKEKPVEPTLPPDEQILRDAVNSVDSITMEAAGWSGFKKLKVVSKTIDQFETDSCTTVTIGRLGGSKTGIFGLYTRQRGFWHLVDQEVRMGI